MPLLAMFIARAMMIVALVGSVSMYFYLYVIRHSPLFNRQQAAYVPPPPFQWDRADRRNVIIVTDSTLDSNILGKLFNQHPRVFYLEQPLYPFEMFKTLNYTRESEYSGQVRAFLDNLFHCRFNGYKDYLTFLSHPGLASPRYRLSSKALSSPPLCTQHIGIYTSTSDFLEKCPLLQAQWVSDVCSIRDPRASVWDIVGRTVGSHGIIDDSQNHNILEDKIKNFCNKMESEVDFSESLPWHLNKQYEVVRYEDVLQNVTSAADRAFMFAGIDRVASSVEDHKRAGTIFGVFSFIFEELSCRRPRMEAKQGWKQSKQSKDGRKQGWKKARMEESKDGSKARMEESKDGSKARMEESKDGRKQGWKKARMEESKDGSKARMEAKQGWKQSKDGRKQGWKKARMEESKDGRKQGWKKARMEEKQGWKKSKDGRKARMEESKDGRKQGWKKARMEESKDGSKARMEAKQGWKQSKDGSKARMEAKQGWKKARMEESKDGRKQGWMKEGWKKARMEESKDGSKARMEESKDGRKQGWKKARMEESKDGRKQGWKKARMEESKDGSKARMKESKDGRKQGWKQSKDGRKQGWKKARMEESKDGRKQGRKKARMEECKVSLL
ncbi:hypothetical protein QZH41_006880 [Actinostola sp. cb2023]|nr:hypothetical protein QZH41_006880 [Actinostola sp. cb2023]